MLVKMSAIKEGESTLLDNVMICYGAGISDGNKHNHDNLPIVLAGGAGNSIKGGRHVSPMARRRRFAISLSTCSIARGSLATSSVTVPVDWIGSVRCSLRSRRSVTCH
jgi:hypothetical protein